MSMVFLKNIELINFCVYAILFNDLRQESRDKMKNLVLVEMTRNMMDEYVDLYINTFTKEPWNDVYESREQVAAFFDNHFNNNYFTGYAAMSDGKAAALSIGFKKPWINGVEYYIDEFCVDYDRQGSGIGSWFINEIEKDIEKKGMNAIMLNTDADCPARKFYEKNGFKVLEGLIILAK